MVKHRQDSPQLNPDADDRKPALYAANPAGDRTFISINLCYCRIQQAWQALTGISAMSVCLRTAQRKIGDKLGHSGADMRRTKTTVKLIETLSLTVMIMMKRVMWL